MFVLIWFVYFVVAILIWLAGIRLTTIVNGRAGEFKIIRANDFEIKTAWPLILLGQIIPFIILVIYDAFVVWKMKRD